MNRRNKNQFKKEITQYVSETFGSNSHQYKKILCLELNKIKQQNQIQIPFILRYYKRNIGKTRILDIGCGTGGATVAWALRGAKCIGIDTSEQDLHIARLRAESEGVKPVLKQVKGTKLPFGNESFDIVICDQVLEHVPNFSETIREMRRVIKKDGIIYVDLPNRFFPHDPHYGILFAHWFPPNIHRFLINLLKRRYFNYPVFFRTYFEVAKQIKHSRFNTLGTTSDFVIASKDKGIKYVVARMLTRLKVPFYFFSPTLQFILQPYKNDNTTEKTLFCLRKKYLAEALETK